MRCELREKMEGMRARLALRRQGEFNGREQLYACCFYNEGNLCVHGTLNCVMHGNTLSVLYLGGSDLEE